MTKIEIGEVEVGHGKEDKNKQRVYLNLTALEQAIEEYPNCISTLCNDDGQVFEQVLLISERIAKNSKKHTLELIDWRPTKIT